MNWLNRLLRKLAPKTQESDIEKEYKAYNKGTDQALADFRERQRAERTAPQAVPRTRPSTPARESSTTRRDTSDDITSPLHPLNPLNPISPLSSLWDSPRSGNDNHRGNSGGGGGYDYGGSSYDGGGSSSGGGDSGGGGGGDITPDPRYDTPRRTLAL